MNSIAPASFSSIGLSNDLVQVVEELGYTQPTPVQEQAIPLLLEGKDVIAQSQTGSGKTAAFTLPIIDKISAELKNREKRVLALVLCPTRELCAQVSREIRKLGRRHAGLQVLVLSGGLPIGPQFASLERGVHIVVGTPGRVLDHLERRSLELSSVKTVVLDEADRMLEMGFQEDMERILGQTTARRQTVLFSATFPGTIEAMSRSYQRSPVRVTIEEKTQALASITHQVYAVEPEKKLMALLWVIEQVKAQTVIVFCNFKASVFGLSEELARLGQNVGALHGDLEQADRDRIMAKFRNRSLNILVATDVAARGIDIESLDLVVNYELPAQPETYVHRVGRTGRAGNRGLAVSMVSAREGAKLENIESYAHITLDTKTLPDLKGFSPDQTVATGVPAMKTLFIGAGRKDKMRPGDILGALTGELGRLSGVDIGKIEIHDRFSYVAVSTGVAEAALERLRNGRIKGRKVRVEPVR